MKTKLFLKNPAAVFFLITSLAASAQPTPQIDAATGLPVRTGAPVVNPAIILAAPGGASAPNMVDPNTGLPIATATGPSEPEWIDPGWTDPGIVLTNIIYDGVPVSEVARDLRERFKNSFDILPMPRTFDQDWGSQITIQLQLKNVKASEVFNAMNLVFENDRTPLRWELKFNGNRPVVLLHVLPEGAPQAGLASPKPAETRRMVFYIGNLLGDEKSGGMTMDQVVETILKIWPREYGNQPDSVIQRYNPAQLLIVDGTPDQIDFIQQTLAALRQKVIAARGPLSGRSQFPRGFGGGGSGGFSQSRNDQNTNNVGDQ